MSKSMRPPMLLSVQKAGLDMLTPFKGASSPGYHLTAVLGLYRPRKELNMAGIAFVNSDTNGKGLQNFNDVVLIRLGLPEPGLYMIFGRVVIRNDDGDAQAASAQSTVLDGADRVDRADVRIPGGSSQTIHLH